MKDRRKRWVVRAGDGTTVADVLGRLGETARAVEAGRVFVGRRRVTRPDERVAVGSGITVGALAAADAEPTILARSAGLVAVDKPPGIPTVADHAGAAHALVARVARAIGVRDEDLRVTSRLDREVSGVVVFALDAAAEKRLVEARAAGAYHRRYVALASAFDDDASPLLSVGQAGAWTWPIGAGRDALHRAVDGSDAKPAATRWRVVARAEGTRALLLAVDPETGRTHQIRVHATHARAPLLGDADYGGPTRLTFDSGKVVAVARIALHAARVSVAGFTAEAPIPTDLARLWALLGGEPEAWNRALSCETSSAPR